MAWVGKNLQSHLVPTLCHGQGHFPLAQVAQNTQNGSENVFILNFINLLLGCQEGGAHPCWSMLQSMNCSTQTKVWRG